ncbi:sulfur carrier protein ThiS [Hamadaea tsunoensis]|uniref:sulfur carrier protein ThiS n=1 Tax=Hamadaea tsunoensis TaxID=53368 RepID=UPI0003F745E2|nr:sulfur carrier protein ThiS [Hamadaea tsunoensis]
MNVVVNGEPREVDAGTTLADLVGTVSRTGKGVAAAVDGAVAPRSTWAALVLTEGVTVELLTAVQGG